MNSAELTALHTETVTALKRAAQESRTLANISRRAASLFADGYQVRSYGDAETNSPETGDGFYVVVSPKGDRYHVWHGPKVGYECNCPCFAEWKTCKHLEAIDLLKRDEEQAAEYDAKSAYDPYEYRY